MLIQVSLRWHGCLLHAHSQRWALQAPAPAPGENTLNSLRASAENKHTPQWLHSLAALRRPTATAYLADQKLALNSPQTAWDLRNRDVPRPPDKSLPRHTRVRITLHLHYHFLLSWDTGLWRSTALTECERGRVLRANFLSVSVGGTWEDPVSGLPVCERGRVLQADFLSVSVGGAWEGPVSGLPVCACGRVLWAVITSSWWAKQLCFSLSSGSAHRNHHLLTVVE